MAVQPPDTTHGPRDTARASLPAPGAPGKLTIHGVPQGGHVLLNNQPVKGGQLDVPAGVYKLLVRAPGYEDFERQVVITPGASSTVRVDMAASGGIGMIVDESGKGRVSKQRLSWL